MQRESIYVEGMDNIVEPRKGDLGYDLIAQRVIEEKNGQITYGTGVKLEPLTPDVHGLVFPRSSIKKYDLRLTNSVAVIDSSYRGEIKLCFSKIGMCKKFYEVGDKIAQIVWFQSLPVALVPVNNVSATTERGEGGFGSTGK